MDDKIAQTKRAYEIEMMAIGLYTLASTRFEVLGSAALQRSVEDNHLTNAAGTFLMNVTGADPEQNISGSFEVTKFMMRLLQRLGKTTASGFAQKLLASIEPKSGAVDKHDHPARY